MINEAIINVLSIISQQAPFHAQDKQHDSSSWLSQIPSFRQETCQTYYTNDPVKYDLNLIWSLWDQIKFLKHILLPRMKIWKIIMFLKYKDYLYDILKEYFVNFILKSEVTQ